jgi:hypothetical protein
MEQHKCPHCWQGRVIPCPAEQAKKPEVRKPEWLRRAQFNRDLTNVAA